MPSASPFWYWKFFILKMKSKSLLTTAVTDNFSSSILRHEIQPWHFIIRSNTCLSLSKVEGYSFYLDRLHGLCLNHQHQCLWVSPTWAVLMASSCSTKYQSLFTSEGPTQLSACLLLSSADLHSGDYRITLSLSCTYTCAPSGASFLSRSPPQPITGNNHHYRTEMRDGLQRILHCIRRVHIINNRSKLQAGHHQFKSAGHTVSDGFNHDTFQDPHPSDRPFTNSQKIVWH